jgi:nucleotidyltransferase/DNA polymerase involved in DNA repair
MRQVQPGMTLAQARAVCADLLWRQYDEELYTKLQTEIIQRLVQASPQVSGLENGIFLLDANGLSYLGGEDKFCRQVQKLINTAGFADMRIGIADTAFAARIASKFKHSRHYIVPPGKDKEFLSTLSLAHMPIPEDMQETLHCLGITSIGQLLQIPVAELQERFGHLGLLALDLAGGIDKTRPSLVQAADVYESAVDLSFPVESCEQTLFILRSMLERICSRLKANDLLADQLTVSFFNDIDKFDERPLRLMRPSSNSKFLLEIIRLSLEASPLSRQYTGLHIQIKQCRPENWQQNKLRIIEAPTQKLLPLQKSKTPPSGSCNPLGSCVAPESSPHLGSCVAPESSPHPGSCAQPTQRSKEHEKSTFVAENNNDTQSEPFILLLQRFITRLGSKSVVRPVACNQHIPEESARFLPLVDDAQAILPLKIDYPDAGAGASQLACGLVLRKSADSQPVLVEYQGKTPTSVTYQGRWHRIKELTEPERLSGLWWENPVRKSYYVALIESCAERSSGSRSPVEMAKSAAAAECDSYLVLLVHDHNNNSWQLDGFFD